MVRYEIERSFLRRLQQLTLLEVRLPALNGIFFDQKDLYHVCVREFFTAFDPACTLND